MRKDADEIELLLVFSDKRIVEYFGRSIFKHIKSNLHFLHIANAVRYVVFIGAEENRKK